MMHMYWNVRPKPWLDGLFGNPIHVINLELDMVVGQQLSLWVDRARLQAEK